jgi:Xaa-Pro dipeptidase
VKSRWEIACIEQASLRAARGHLRAAREFDAGERSELAIHLGYLAASGQDDVDCPYKNIVALGQNGATLHHIEYQRVPDAASLLIDAGARYSGYCSDITRTHVAGDASPVAALFASLVDAVEQLQLRVIGRIETGASYEALHDVAHEEMGRLLAQAELITCSAEAAVETGLTRTFFPHGLGHHLGIQVHDVAGLPRSPRPENRFLRNTRTIEPGQVFTIEPGLYFIEALLAELRETPAGGSVQWSTVDALRPFGGIRIEDDVLVLADGSEPRVRNLTREAFARTEG